MTRGVDKGVSNNKLKLKKYELKYSNNITIIVITSIKLCHHQVYRLKNRTLECINKK